MNLSPKALLALALLAIPAEAASGWEAAPFMDEPPFGLDSTHTFGFSLRGKAYAITGNLRVPEFDYCGDCRGAKDADGNPVRPYSTYTDAFYAYDPTEGWKDLGPFPNGGFHGARGFSQGDIMARGTPDEILYWGLGQSRHLDADGNDLNIYPQWAFNEDKTEYSLVENKTNYPRLTDWWSFDGTDWKRLADFPGIGRTHPAVAAANGKVVVGLGFGELCPSTADPCTATSYLEDPRGKSGNLQDAHVYDVATDTWDSSVEPFPYPAHHPMHFGLEGSNGGHFFVAGHNGAKVHNRSWKLVEAQADSAYNYVWEEVAAVPGLGRVAGTQFDHGGFGYMMGGETAANKDNRMPGFGNAADYDRDPNVLKEDHRSMEENEVWRYDPEADEWAQLPSTPDDGSRWAGSNFVLDDYLYCFQGVNRKGHYQFNNFTMTWPTQGWRLYLPNATALVPATTAVEDGGGDAGTTAVESSAFRSSGRLSVAATVAALIVATLL